MRHIFLDQRGGRLALYLNGDLQFDRDDERLYHEPLALVPVLVARQRRPARPLRVLVLGGGDGLALREVLRLPDVAEAHLVDHDADVVRLARTMLAPLNENALGDRRAHVHVRDAAAFLRHAKDFDVIVHDLTYPRDVAGAALFNLRFFQRARAALADGGVLAVNAVSPELTPQAFGCVAATLGAAGFATTPHTFELPSFRAEGYGRWGFLFASTLAISESEILGLRFPSGARVNSATLLAGAELPAAAADAMRAAVNRTDELLYYLYNGTPLPWTGPFGHAVFSPSGAVTYGPRLTAAQGFAHWLRRPAGRRSLDELLACLPLSRRGQTRQALLEWSRYAETLFRELDLLAFVERALARARGLPREWVTELRQVAERLRGGMPDLDDLLHHAYRVFAIFLLVMLVANLFFPDNLYAKHTSSGGSGSAPSALFFTDPQTTLSPFGFRGFGGAIYGTPGGMVPDARGQQYPPKAWTLGEATGQTRPVGALLALSKDLRLLESGVVAYSASVLGYQFFVEPGRLSVVDQRGRDVMATLPDPTLETDVRTQLGTLRPLIDKAIADHSRWLEWVRWGSSLAPGQEAVSELGVLDRIKSAIASAEAVWAKPSTAAFMPSPQWKPLLPGLYLKSGRPGEAAPTLVTVTPDGTAHERSLVPPAQLTDEDRFVFRALQARTTTSRDARLGAVIARWQEVHGPALKLPGAAPGGSWTR